MTNNAYVGFTKVRSTKEVKNGKRKVYTRGYAATPDKFDTYQFMKRDDGTYKEFKSLFTQRCIDDLERQFLTKSVFVDAGHTLAADDGVLRLLRERGVAEESDEYQTAKEMLKMKRLPLAKVVGFKVDNSGFIVETETNPYFADVDEDHARFYSATCNSLLDRYYQGYSINFSPADCVTEIDDNGNEITKFNKINLYGISYATNLPLPDNSFTEVCLRMAKETFNLNKTAQQDVNDMNNGMNTQQPPQKQDATQQQNNQQSVDVEKIREQVKADLIKEQQFEEMRKQQELLKKEIDELRAKSSESSPGAKGVVSNQNNDKYGQQRQPAGATAKPEFDVTSKEQWTKKLNEITEGYQKWQNDVSKPTPPDLWGFQQSYRGRPQDGFAELVRLQSMLQSHKMPRPGESPEEHSRRLSLMAQQPSDEIVLKRTRQL